VVVRDDPPLVVPDEAGAGRGLLLGRVVVPPVPPPQNDVHVDHAGLQLLEEIDRLALLDVERLLRADLARLRVRVGQRRVVFPAEVADQQDRGRGDEGTEAEEQERSCAAGCGTLFGLRAVVLVFVTATVGAHGGSNLLSGTIAEKTRGIHPEWRIRADRFGLH
jgi:hypothetical protein